MIKLVGVLLDRNTGDILLDEKNNIIEINNKNAFEQILIGIFNCDVGSEILNAGYGFDLKRALRESYVEDSEMFIESLVMEALNPEKERLISKVDYIKATRNGREMDVVIQITSIFNDQVVITEEIG